ncbi:DUF2062 domain-containing protein [Halopseudomonas salegens]|uniref:DUF2062 domain-containing protein n=1 Tax=Halopseudomonas salegens TaxID=1434072 RepID=A0A1H2EXV0_9GAMM|nr:DUF2062 domain-containing protein [Halopseudomonas salegens]SDT99915.1 hypothetical protein SAMN05216210_1128 [Halopseudomonas salegens]
MPRNLIKRYLPKPEKITGHKSLRFLGSMLHDPNLWHLNRHSVARGMALGLFNGMLPIPLQMLLSAILAVPLRANLPISVALVWVSNPVTMPALFFFQYKLGAWLLGTEEHSIPMRLSLSWIMAEIQHFWQPLLAGALIMGIGLAIIGYAGTMLYWRFWVSRSWHQRKLRRSRHS